MDHQVRKRLFAQCRRDQQQQVRRFGLLLVFLPPLLILGLSGTMTALDRVGSVLIAVLPVVLIVGVVGLLGVSFVATVMRVILACLQDALDAFFPR